MCYCNCFWRADSSTPPVSSQPDDFDNGSYQHQDPVFVFRITAADPKAVDRAKEHLERHLKDLTDTEIVKNDLIGIMGSRFVQQIMSLQSADLKINIGELTHILFIHD